METVVEYLQSNPTAMGYQVGALIAEKYERKWTPASLERIGNSLRQWGIWLIRGTEKGIIPTPPGRKGDSERGSGAQMRLPL